MDQRDPLVDKWLASFPATDANTQLLVTLIADWRREAGNDAISAQVIAIKEGDFKSALESRSASEREAFLHASVLDASLRELERRSLAAGKALKAQTLSEEAAKAEGKALLEAAQALRTQLKALPSDETHSTLHQLGNLEMEALYLIERKLMSRRYQEIFGS